MKLSGWQRSCYQIAVELFVAERAWWLSRQPKPVNPVSARTYVRTYTLTIWPPISPIHISSYYRNKGRED